ncbi:MAG: CpaD family pilus assembly lipoprotein [Rhodomicrobiaceae bacterium]
MRGQNCILALLILLTVPGGCAGTDGETEFTHIPVSCEAGRAAKEAWRPGCATHRNLTAMAARSDDLYLARPEAPRDATRRDAVIGNYAQGSSSAAGSAVTTAPAAPSSGAGSPQ